MAFCLFGSVFIQPKPAIVDMVMCLGLLVLSLSLSTVRLGISRYAVSSLRPVWIAMLVWPLATAALMVIQPYPIPLQSLGNPVRAALALGILAYLLVYPARWEYLVAGVALACLASFCHGIYDIYASHAVRALGWFNNENHFGNYSALVGVLAVIIGFLAAGFQAQTRIGLLVLGVAALWSAAASGTRTSAFIVVCLLPFLLRKFNDRTARLLRKLMAACLILALGLALVSPKVQNFVRLKEAQTDFEKIQNATGGSSIGDRLQMWRASINMFHESPVLGVGLANYEKELKLQIEQKKVRPLLTSQNQAHSQPLHSLATGGISLLLAYVIFLVGPFWWFFHAYKRSRENWKASCLAYMGMTIVASHAIFSLTVAIFDVQVFSSLYVVCVCCIAGMVFVQLQEQHPAST